MAHRRPSDGWGTWFLALAAALPLAVVVRTGWVVLGGSVDDVFGSQDQALSRPELLGIRWSNLWGTQSVPGVLLTGLLPLAVLTGVAVAGRPRALAPTGSGRTVATLVAAATAAVGLLGVVGFVAQLVGLLPVTMWTGFSGSKLDSFGPAAAAVLTTAVLGSVATAVLWPWGAHDSDADDSASQDREPGDGGTPGAEGVEPDDGDRGPADQSPADQSPADQGPAEPVPAPGPSVPERATQGFPVPTDDETHLYRRR